MNKQRTVWVALTALALFATACDTAEPLEVRTFAVNNLGSHEVATLIEPYVYADRDGAAGTYSTTSGAVTVRETADNLAKIERVLAEYDHGRADIRLHFQLIEADGFTDSDARIAAVEEELRKIFQFQGYRLAGEGVVSATDGSNIGQTIQATDDLYEITGEVNWVGPGQIRLGDIALYGQNSSVGLRTTVNIRPRQTLVLGSSPKPGSSATLLLTVRAEEVPPSNK